MSNEKMDEYLIDAIVRFTDFNEDEAMILYHSGLQVHLECTHCNTFGQTGELLNTPSTKVLFQVSDMDTFGFSAGNPIAIPHDILSNLLRGERPL